MAHGTSKQAPANEMVLQRVLDGILQEIAYMDADDREQAGIENLELFEDVGVETFEGAGLMTSDAGLVLTFPDGTEYQLTIVKR